jgi:transcriptional regulator with XRE-family HTH domain
VDPRKVGRLHRALRYRLKWRQVDVAKKSGVSRTKISEIETGNLERVSLIELERSVLALGARLDIWIVGGPGFDRLLDEGHARLAALVAAQLRRLGWAAQFEVTFARMGERGSIDLLAWHAGTRSLLVVEIKTELVSVEGLLRPLDVKSRLAPEIAARFGWRPLSVSRLVALPENSTARRTVARHADTLRAALPARSHDVRSWLANPVGTLRGMWFLSAASAAGVTQNPSSIRRVRVSKPHEAERWNRPSATTPRRIGPEDGVSA